MLILCDSTMSLITKYTENTFAHQRQYELYADTIQASGWSIGRDFNITIPLKNLTSHFQRLRAYNQLYSIGMLLSVVGTFIAFVFFTIGISALIHINPGIMSAIVGLLLMAFNMKKVESITFFSEAGFPLLTITRIGRQSEEFEQFISILVSQIQSSKDNHQSSVE